MEVTFICGCETKDIIARENVTTMSLVAFDHDGMLICAIHHQRRKNWRSIPVHENVSNVRIKKSYLGKTPQEIEGHIVFGDPWVEKTVNVNFDEPDKRDNRDPQTVKTWSGI